MIDLVYLVLADAVFGLHLLFILAVLPSTALFCLGGYRTRPFLQYLHCTGVYVMAAGQIAVQACPLVPLERALREAAGESPWYRGSFTVFVVERATGFELPVAVVASLSILVIALTTLALLAPRLRATLSLSWRVRSSKPATRR